MNAISRRRLLQINGLFVAVFLASAIYLTINWVRFADRYKIVEPKARLTGDEQTDKLIAANVDLEQTIITLIDDATATALVLAGCAILGFTLNFTLLCAGQKVNPATQRKPSEDQRAL